MKLRNAKNSGIFKSFLDNFKRKSGITQGYANIRNIFLTEYTDFLPYE